MVTLSGWCPFCHVLTMFSFWHNPVLTQPFFFFKELWFFLENIVRHQICALHVLLAPRRWFPLHPEPWTTVCFCCWDGAQLFCSLGWLRTCSNPPCLSLQVWVVTTPGYEIVLLSPWDLINRGNWVTAQVSSTKASLFCSFPKAGCSDQVENH